MSVLEAIVDKVERAISFSDKTRSLDSILPNEKSVLSEFRGEESRAGSVTNGFKVDELFLPNGESYSGSILGSKPEGLGKYAWSDGSEYEGEWRHGMRQGYGKLKWPSGALYEGEFSGNYMHGTGTYTRSDGMTYKGRWRLNLKHGLGFQSYPNGDVFEGSWIRGTPEGPGKYSWACGNVYLGNMKGGKMSGKGILNWINGDSFEGNWLNGMIHGFGVYTWADGGCYVGTWTRGLKDGKGTFYPKGSSLPADMREVEVGGIRNSVWNSSDNLSSGLLNLEQSHTTISSLKRSWSLEVSIEKVIGHYRSSSSSETVLDGEDNGIDINPPILEREYIQGILISELVLSNRFSPSSRRIKRRQKRLAKEIKRPGEQIIKGHRSYDLMLSLQLGIRYTVGKITPIPSREVRATDFGSHASFWMNFPREGSQLTPPHRSDDFKWKDYCPMVFRNLREMFGIDAADYMMSICGNDALRELSSPGKSGSVFFLSQDDRFMIKTLRKSEVKVLLRMLPNYYRHVCTYDNTLITKFFGLHRIKPSSGQKFRFVVMGNVFCTELRIHRRFDLKGSRLGRSADKVEIDENTILKDLDLDYCFYLEPSWQNALLQQIEIDSKFLESENIMDYSLLLGVHHRAPQHARPPLSYGRHISVDGLGVVAENESMEDEITPQGLVLVPHGADDKDVIIGSHIRGNRLRASSASGNNEVDLLLPGTARLQIQLGVNMPARAEHISRGDDARIFHEAYDVVLYLGIIDILQEYNVSKKIEHAYKSIHFNPLWISAVAPKFYSQRFLDFIQKVFPPNAEGLE
ncbi:phosphatidylinositol 4-phosphate 5-kinase 9 [Dorcoceras hygrometricum]|uniref:Phosphatidylinositol 4-phosphate 5-kinase n=1 Tax=Dorcoceras hygrometricum TaxID=472368 RepID=A0A2Z7AWG0_9LAMI|nr:phosphatidylinositol 4-phosphate 5-kinase 9 [Dorcoceras hygrometricum]